MKSLLLTLVFAATSAVASAQLANLDFETGDFAGWTVSGDARIYSHADVEIIGIAPFEGAFGALLVPDSSIVHATGIYLSAGDTVSVWMNGSQSGRGGLDLIPDNGLSIHVSWQPVYLPGEIFPVKWSEVSFKIQEAGIYSIGASSPEGADGPSFLGVDLFTVTPVPEPSAYGLLAALSVVAAIMWSRCKTPAATAT